jgi:hypothetical protein
MPTHAQDILVGAGRALGASRISAFIAAISYYGAEVGIATPTVVIQPAVIKSLATVS